MQLDLMELGFNPRLSGYQYLAKAVELVLENPKMKHMITKALYPTVAKAYDTKWRNVEGNIRYSITRAYFGPTKFSTMFASMIDEDEKPNNGLAITVLAEMCRRQKMEVKHNDQGAAAGHF